MTHDEIKADILQYLSDEYWYCKDKNGRFNVEMYADYRDELCESSINEILQQMIRMKRSTKRWMRCIWRKNGISSMRSSIRS